MGYEAYTNERNNQIVVELLKHHGIRKIVTSPGGTNVTFVASVQRDPFFELYSSVDERSAAYIACGIAAESGEPVVISCTGATAARNYFSGLTEAYYRKLPILAITSTMPIERIGHNFPQLTDRTVVSKDIAKLSVHIPLIKDAEDEWACIIRANEAMLELKHHGYGPVHMNVETSGAPFNTKEIKDVQPIDRIMENENFPEITGKRVGLFVGTHLKWGDDLTHAVDKFCEKYNAVVLGDHTSNYKGIYSVPASLASSQKMYKPDCLNMDLLIHIGDISGAYLNLFPKETWRVSADGKICDTFKKLRYVFEMQELSFFEYYNKKESHSSSIEYFNVWKSEYNNLSKKIPSLPFSNIYVASRLSTMLPEGSVLHLGILNSLRSWNFYPIDKSIDVYCNTGGFGIDGCVSSLLGASMTSKQKLFFGVVGDLAFFYDMNCLGNRDLGSNIRLIVINNGIGQEFKNYGSRAAEFGNETDEYIAASGHFGNKSPILLKSYVEALGIRYLSACDHASFNKNVKEFVQTDNVNQPIVFEIFTESKDETEALKILCTLDSSVDSTAKNVIKNVLGEKNVHALKKIIRG